MKEKYRGKVKVPFCVKYSSTVPLGKLGSLLFEISGEEEFYVFRYWNYYGINFNEDVDCWDTPRMFGENTAVYTLEELQAIVDEVNNDTATLTEDEYVDVGEDETVSNERLKLIGKYVKTPLYPTEWAIVEKYIKDQDIYEVVYSFQDGDGVFVPADCLLEVVDTIPQTTALSIKANISFDVTIKGQTFNLTPEELQDLYVQLCLAEGTLQDWRLGK